MYIDIYIYIYTHTSQIICHKVTVTYYLDLIISHHIYNTIN